MKRCLVALLLLLAPAAHAEGTTTSTAARSAEDLELARYLDMLQNWDLLQQWELFELYPVLQEEREE